MSARLLFPLKSTSVRLMRVDTSSRFVISLFIASLDSLVSPDRWDTSANGSPPVMSSRVTGDYTGGATAAQSQSTPTEYQGWESPVKGPKDPT